MHEYVHTQTGLEFVLIPGGQGLLGSPPTELGRKEWEKSPQPIKLQPFLMSKYVVTQGVWRKVMGTEPWQGKEYVEEGADYPAVYINWYEAKEFCQKTGLALPSEAQWEYACRANRNTSYYWGENSQDLDYFHCLEFQKHVHFCRNTWEIGQQHASKVGRKLPNAFGLHDMLGNVWEWCEDIARKIRRGEFADAPRDWRKEKYERVCRGGSWWDEVWDCRCASRSMEHPRAKGSGLGFRVVKALDF
ncbi:MAG: formylglycine-generating enzyme family protein [Planctomycetota bacterium]|nr:MAG: formylglycine-generating enzyme family protein [Planctomycetota bacterium]